jgi:putative SOS response-associated peptidase YedK
MCGRFFQDLSEEEIASQFEAEAAPSVSELAAGPRYNIGPGQPIWAIRVNPKTHRRTLDALHWGLIPHFAADRKGAYRCINARSETIDRTAAFRTAFARRRCLVVARGFYEWRREGKLKQPFAIMPSDGTPLAFAAVWENWLDQTTGEWVRSVAIVTTEANQTLSSLHDRMPVVIAPGAYARWLGEEPTSPEQLKALLRGDRREFRIWPVSPRMNRADVEDASILDPVPLPP